MKQNKQKVATLAATLITFGSLAGGANAALLSFTGITDSSGFYIDGSTKGSGQSFSFDVEIEATTTCLTQTLTKNQKPKKP